MNISCRKLQKSATDVNCCVFLVCIIACRWCVILRVAAVEFCVSLVQVSVLFVQNGVIIVD